MCECDASLNRTQRSVTMQLQALSGRVLADDKSPVHDQTIVNDIHILSLSTSSYMCKKSLNCSFTLSVLPSVIGWDYPREVERRGSSRGRLHLMAWGFQAMTMLQLEVVTM